MSTALALVNRIRAKRRDATSAVITDRQGVAYLDILNTAITTVLEERTWDFQSRNNGTISTVPRVTGATGSATRGAAAFSATDFNAPDAMFTPYGDYQARLQITDDTGGFANTAFRIATTDLAGALLTATLSPVWPGVSQTLTAAYTYMVYEYILPSTVRQVTSVTNQESPVALAFEDETYTFEKLVPRPQDTFSDFPEFVMVGGEIQRTATTGSTGEYGLALRVYPVPISRLQLNYSYIYRQPLLTVAADDLLRVPPVIEDLIVELATARVISLLEKDVQTGLPLEARVMKTIDRQHRNHKPDAGQSGALLSLDHIGRTADMNRVLGTIPTLAGS